MKYKIFGANTGLYASELILGGAMFGAIAGYGASKDGAIEILKGYAEAGGNFIDTADAYQFGESEKVIGEFISSNRNDFIISSKFTRSASVNPSISLFGNNRKAMVQSVEGSLRRLGTDRIDIYIAHFDDGVTPTEELVRGFDDLIRAGKIVYGGFSNFAAWKIATAVNTSNLRGQASIVALQTEYNLVQMVPNRDLLPMAEHFGLGIMAYSPLAGGLLTGKYRRNETGRINVMRNEALLENPRNNRILDVLTDIANEKETTPSKIAVAWVTSQGIFPVIGPRSKMHLDDYLASTTVKLAEYELQRLNTVSEIPLEYPHDLTKIQQRNMMQRWD